MSLSAWQMKHFISENSSFRPHFIEDLPQQAGTVGLDYHNPKIFPFVGQSDMYPVEAQSYLWTIRDMSLNYNGVINRATEFLPIDNYSPRHISYQGWLNDPLMKDYLAQNSKLFFFSKYAVYDRPGVFEDIIHRHLASDVIMVEGKEASVMARIPYQIKPFSNGEDQWSSISKVIDDTWPNWDFKDDMAIWDFPLDGNIPNYLATNILAIDHWVRFFIQTADGKYIELSPAQGQLIRPMTFDAQNIKEGKVFVALPANTSFVGFKGILLIKTRDASGITSVWRHHSDETGINFLASCEGWMSIQYPYDPKWQVELDGKKIPFYRVNKSFIGFPITQGEHKILVRYWPDSWLRWGLPLSIFMTMALFIALIIFALLELP